MDEPTIKKELIRELDRIMAAIGRFFASAREGFREFPLSGPQFFLLRHLLLAGPASISDIAAGLRLNQSTVSNVVNDLHRLHLVTKQIDPMDRRVVQVQITAEGRRVAEKTEAARCDRMNQLFSYLSEAELADLVRIFTNLQRGLNQFPEGRQ